MNKLNSKDYIFAGAFAAIFVVFIVVMMSIMGFNPITQLIGPCITAIIGGPIFFLYVTKVPKKGAILILSILMSVIMISTSMLPLIICISVGSIGEVLAYLGKYTSKKLYSIVYGFFGIAIMSPLSILFVARETYLEQIVKFYGQAYATALSSYATTGVLVGLFVLAFLSGVIGSIFGIRVLKKHFMKAGIV